MLLAATCAPRKAEGLDEGNVLIRLSIHHLPGLHHQRSKRRGLMMKIRKIINPLLIEFIMNQSESQDEDRRKKKWKMRNGEKKTRALQR
jgi:hypothetical protein